MWRLSRRGVAGLIDSGRWCCLHPSARGHGHEGRSRLNGIVCAAIRSSSSSSSISVASSEDLPDCMSDIRRALPESIDLTTNRYELERHGRGESYHPVSAPDIVAAPSCLDDVREIVRYCVDRRVPIIPFGAGTSLEGHVSALRGGVSLDMRSFQDIQIPDVNGDDDHPDPFAVVGAGVTRMTLNDALRHTGMQYVVDPGADATLGGMVGTCASGTTTVRYGTVRDNLLEIECVLPDEDATVVRAGSRALKNSAGYDLLSLLCGSEGTLAVTTSVTVKLHPVPEHVASATCTFDSLRDAASAVTSLKLREIPVLRSELLDGPSVAAYNKYNENQENVPPMEVKPTLFLDFQGVSEDSLAEVIEMTRSVCVDENNATNFRHATTSSSSSSSSSSTDADARNEMWRARHSLYRAAVASRPGSITAIVTDACVPASKFVDLVEATARDVRDAGVVGPCFGHAGDGNIHCILPVRDDDDDDYRARLEFVQENMMRRTLEAGGTCTGEHGVGYGKIKYLQRQYGSGAVHMMKLIKRAIDPHNIMNPGKVVIV